LPALLQAAGKRRRSTPRRSLAPPGRLQFLSTFRYAPEPPAFQRVSLFNG
jgi:hypothetical protein